MVNSLEYRRINQGRIASVYKYLGSNAVRIKGIIVIPVKIIDVAVSINLSS